MNLETEIKNATDKIIKEQLPNMVIAKVTDMVDEILKDLFSNYGDVAKNLKEQISKKLNVNIDRFALADYNTFVSKAITNSLQKQITENCVKPIEEFVLPMITKLEKKEWRISEIYEEVQEQMMTDDEPEGSFTFIVKEDYERKWFTIGIDEEPDTDIRDCDIEVLMHISSSKEKEEGIHSIFLLRAKTVWNQKGEVDPIKLSNLNNIQELLFRLYSGKAEITIDETDFDQSWSRYN